MPNLKMQTMTYAEAAEFLEITSGALSSAISRGRIEAKDGIASRASVEAYKKSRDETKARGARKATGLRADWVKGIENKIVDAVSEFFMNNGYPPVYTDLLDAAGVAKSGVSRYVNSLVQQKRLELYNGKVFPVGMQEALKEAAKEFLNDNSHS